MVVRMRARAIVYTVLIAALAALMVYALRTREPVYQGKRLSEWMDRAASDGNQAEIDEAVAAIRHIGTNGIPFLLDELQARDPLWVKALGRVDGRLPFNLDLPSAGARVNRAIGGFVILGEGAAPAIPKLTELMLDAPALNATAAVEAIRFAGGTNAVPILICGLTNLAGWPQVWTAQALGSLSNHSAPAVPALLANLTSPDSTVRSSCASALGKIASQFELVVPALTILLADPDQNVRIAAAIALGEFKGGALSAAPALRQLSGGSDGVAHAARWALFQVQIEWSHGAIVRGPKDEKKIALMFTGHEYAEGAEVIIEELVRHRANASFFLTGDFLANPNFAHIVRSIIANDHLLGPHSDKHLLYCSWDAERKLLVNQGEFTRDLRANVAKIKQAVASVRRHDPLPAEFDSAEERAFRERYGLPNVASSMSSSADYSIRYFLPPYEHYNQQIAAWTREMGMILINFTPGTRSNADYTGEADKNFVPTQVIFDSIVKKEREDPHGLNGFLLFLHLGAGPGRADKFHPRFGELLDYLAGKGYEFVRVDELLEPK